MDLIALLAAAPPWVRTVASALIAAWTFATLLGNALRAVPEAQYVRLERAWPRAGQLARAARKFGSDVQPFLAALLGALLGRPVHEDPEQPQPRAAERGFARPGALLVVVVLALGALVACPRLPPPDGCAPAAWRCAGDRPERCSPERRWTPLGDLPCGATGLVCVLTTDRARCAAGGAQ